MRWLCSLLSAQHSDAGAEATQNGCWPRPSSHGSGGGVRLGTGFLFLRSASTLDDFGTHDTYIMAGASVFGPATTQLMLTIIDGGTGQEGLP